VARLIGILCDDSEKAFALEFFQLFKTPWEFYREGKKYPVVVSSLPDALDVDADLLVFYYSLPSPFDARRGLYVKPPISDQFPYQDGTNLPIYGRLASFRGIGNPLIYDKSTGEAFAIQFVEGGRQKLRVGYDLFQEIAFLLTEGQPAENAMIPTLELHISLLREWIVGSGIPLVEIPPFPWGHSFIACLTHDVDFAGIRRYFLDYTMWGFIYRGLVGSLISFLKGKITQAKLFKNWIAVIKLPLVFLGVSDDFWEHFDNYAKIDTGFGSTYFLIPFKNKAGDKIEGFNQKRRAVRYDINNVSKQAKYLISLGYEIGLHGIDAWHSTEKGLQELTRIVETTGQKEIGIRMHWLYYNRRSPSILEQAGFDYDATLGYNETIGFKNGTTQVFKPFEVARLLEIPLNIQDTALFFPRRMALSDADANRICDKLLKAIIKFKGVLTISWHERSLVPERLWGDFYVHLLQELQFHHAWIGSARQVVAWFRQRRSIIFEETSLIGGKFKLKIRGDHPVSDLQIFFRLHIPQSKNPSGGVIEQHYYDIIWNGDPYIEIPLNEEIEAW
jgi:hypothetical protein